MEARMKRASDCFSTYHPVLNFSFFGFVILTTIFVLHPALLAFSFAAGMAYSIYLNGKKAVKFNLLLLLPLMLIAAVINPAFNHEGVTILIYVRDNPITLESIYYGVASAVMLGAVILWFSCYNAVMTSDKFVYLFGRLIPALSLIFSMVLRFVPKYKYQIKKVADAQRCIGKDISSGNVFARAGSGIMILSVMTTWALENSIETADSMKSRGYGLRGRTAYSNYRFDGRDRLLLLILIALLLAVLYAMASGLISVQYFPAFQMNETGAFSVPLYCIYGVLCFLPLILDIKEDAAWRYLRSRV
jgi:energy-coupling factor transport system permease protein